MEFENWNKPILMIQCVVCPIVAAILTQAVTTMIGGKFPLVVLLLIIGLAFAVAMFFTSKLTQPPIYHRFIAYVGFIMAVIWIYRLAEEVVNILTTIGIAFGITEAMLGLTLLAWANSLGDLIADISVAAEGYPRMAVSACFGSPLFNLLMGVGISCTILIVKHGQSYDLEFGKTEQLLILFIGISLIFSLIFVPLMKFRARRVYGICLIVIYVVFIVIAVSTELEKIPPIATHLT